MKYRVAVLCEKCGAEYRTRAISADEDGNPRTPARCKVCSSSRLIPHPEPEESENLDVNIRAIPVTK